MRAQMRAERAGRHWFLLAVFCCGAAVAFGQTPAPTAAPGAAAASEQAPAPAPASPGAQTAPAAPAPPAPQTGHSYNREGRRDPFVSLSRRGSDVAATPGMRAAGLRGLGVGEVTLRGTVASQGGFVAIVQGSDSKTYIVRPGERLADGTIRSITSDALVILQQVNDPLSLEKQREVRKVLRQTEEGRQ